MKHLPYLVYIIITIYKNKDNAVLHNIIYLVFDILPGNLKFHMALSFV